MECGFVKDMLLLFWLINKCLQRILYLKNDFLFLPYKKKLKSTMLIAGKSMLDFPVRYVYIFSFFSNLQLK